MSRDSASAFNPVALRGSSYDGLNQPGECAVNCVNADQLYSFHTGGANVLFADGAVHFLHNAVSIRVVAALATRAGGEVVSDSGPLAKW